MTLTVMTRSQSCRKVKSKILNTCNLVELVSNSHNKTKTKAALYFQVKLIFRLINPDTFVHGLK